jgi:hypothetical protein
MINYVQYETILSDRLHFKSLKDTSQHLTIDVVDNYLKLFSIRFDYVLTYTVTDESYRLNTLSQLPKNLLPYGLLLATNSENLMQFHHESCYMYEDEMIYHFLLITSGEIIDIITTNLPVILSL